MKDVIVTFNFYHFLRFSLSFKETSRPYIVVFCNGSFKNSYLQVKCLHVFEKRYVINWRLFMVPHRWISSSGLFTLKRVSIDSSLPGGWALVSIATLIIQKELCGASKLSVICGGLLDLPDASYHTSALVKSLILGISVSSTTNS